MQTHQGSLMLAQCQALCCEGESAVSRTGSLPLKSNLEGRQPTSPVVWVDSLLRAPVSGSHAVLTSTLSGH